MNGKNELSVRTVYLSLEEWFDVDLKGYQDAHLYVVDAMRRT